jgi:RNA polymerase sigma factor (sigma-70 family)
MGIPSPTSSLTQESDADLIVLVGLAGDGPAAEAEAALEVLYTRHAGFLKGCALENRFHESGVDVDAAVSRTFQKIWERAGTFDPKKSHPGCDPNRAAKLWMIRILENECKDARRSLARRLERPREIEPSDPSPRRDILDGDDPPDQDLALIGEGTQSDGSPDRLSPYRLLFQKWFQTLSQPDQDLMRLSAAYTSPVPPYRCEIPAQELNALANALGVIPETIKVKRQRLIKKFKEFARTHL